MKKIEAIIRPERLQESARVLRHTLIFLIVAALTIIAAADATHSIQWTFAGVIIDTYAPSFGTDGAPLTAALTFASQHSATMSSVLQTVVKNAVATP